MSSTMYLFIANCVVWVGVAGYLVFLATRTAGLERRIRQIELLGGDDDQR